MKRILSLAAVIMILSAVISTPVSAHSSHHGGLGANEAAVSYSVCTVKDCAKAGLHLHGGTYRYAHYYGDGHDYHPFCDIEDCVVADYHAHDGEYCFGHTPGDGHDYHAYCGTSGCTQTGYHEHSSVYCFSHTVNDGHGHNYFGSRHH